jgi:hypothetical protein
VCEPVSYPRFEKRTVEGRRVLVKLADLQYTVCTAVPLGNESLAAQNPRSDE